MARGIGTKGLGLGLGTKLIKGVFFISNFIFFCFGIAVLSIGIQSRVINDNWEQLGDDANSIATSANILIAAGVIVTVVGFLGCCGACKQIIWMLKMYIIVVVIIFILEIAAGIFVYTKRGEIEASFTEHLKKDVMKKYGGNDVYSAAITKMVDWLQTLLQCCGANGPNDWRRSNWYNPTLFTTSSLLRNVSRRRRSRNTTSSLLKNVSRRRRSRISLSRIVPKVSRVLKKVVKNNPFQRIIKKIVKKKPSLRIKPSVKRLPNLRVPAVIRCSKCQVPKSCCISPHTGCNIDPILPITTIFKEGCIARGKQFVEKNVWALGGVGIGIAVFQLLGIVYAILLYRAYNRGRFMF